MLGPRAPRLKGDSNPARVATTFRTGPRGEAIFGATMATGDPSRQTGIAKADLCVGRGGRVAAQGKFIYLCSIWTVVSKQ